jgi:hypothetical protein
MSHSNMVDFVNIVFKGWPHDSQNDKITITEQKDETRRTLVKTENLWQRKKTSVFHQFRDDLLPEQSSDMHPVDTSNRP